MHVEPDDRPSEVVGEYVDVNNLGTTRVLRAFAPRLRDGGRLVVVASSLGTLHYLAPVLHDQFNSAVSLDDADDVVRKWREAVRTGSAVVSAWPAFINIPSKIAQVAAVRTLAHSRREEDLRRDVLIVATCPGMMDTATSRPWFDTSNASSPAQAAGPLLDLVLAPARPDHYGELVRNGQVLPWTP
jgi:NAD(P)-dependent dehydrogenase (short-subunit alcohol dehydrogenase family)